jgi:flagellar L-ring protein FlgH
MKAPAAWPTLACGSLRAALAPLVAAALAAGCMNGPLNSERVPELRKDFPAPPVEATPPPTQGSLWRGDASRRFLAFENRAKQLGDLVTVVIREKAEAENSSTTDLERTSEITADLNSDIQLQTLITRPVRNILKLLGFTSERADRDPGVNVSVVDAQTESTFEGEGTIERQSEFTTTIACVVTEVTPAGLLRIEGERHLTINFETQIIELSGYVRPEDIQIDNTVPSSLVASADIHFGGRGVLSAKQRVPWFTRLVELVLPF